MEKGSKNKQRSHKPKQSNYIKPAVITLLSWAMLFSGYKIVSYVIESIQTKTRSAELETIANPSELSSENEQSAETICDENVENNPDSICSPEKNQALSNAYWQYLDTPLLSVDIEALKNENTDTVGWIQVPGTYVNYPFVQTGDNSYYLEHSFDKSYNSAGWVFLDYRNTKSLDQKNNIIYAHGRIDNAMFGSLRWVLNSNWLDNSDNHVIRTVTETGSKNWQVFSVYRIRTTSDYLKTSFTSDRSFVEFLEMIKSRSVKDFGIELGNDIKILTLSTCYNDDEKLVIHAFRVEN